MSGLPERGTPEGRGGPAKRRSARTRWPVAAGLLLALAAAAFLRFESVAGTTVIAPLRADAKDYFLYAFNLRHNGAYSRSDVLTDPSRPPAPDAVRSPGYPLFLSAFVGGTPTFGTLRSVALAQAAIGTLTVLLTFVLARGATSPAMALAAAFLAALAPHLVVGSSYLLTETLFGFLAVASAILFARPAESASRGAMALGGVLLGAASLVRPVLIHFPAVLSVYHVARFGRDHFRRKTVWLIAGFCLVVAPWYARNLITLRAFSDDTLTINFLHHGMYPGFLHDGRPETYGYPYRFDPRSPEISRSTRAVLSEIAGRFRADPARYVAWYLAGKPAAFWSWGYVQGAGDIFIYPVSASPYLSDPAFRATRSLMRALHPALVLAGLAGCLLPWFPRARAAVPAASVESMRGLSLLLLYVTAFHMIGAPFPRYSVPFRPILFAMAAATAGMLAGFPARRGRAEG